MSVAWGAEKTSGRTCPFEVPYEVTRTTGGAALSGNTFSVAGTSEVPGDRWALRTSLNSVNAEVDGRLVSCAKVSHKWAPQEVAICRQVQCSWEWR